MILDLLRKLFGGNSKRTKNKSRARTIPPQWEPPTETHRPAEPALSDADTFLQSTIPSSVEEVDEVEVPSTDEASKDELKTRLATANDFNSCVQIADEAAENDFEELEDLALRKALELASTPEECQEVYDRSPQDGEVEKLSTDKQEGFFLRRLEGATTVAECLKIEREANSDFDFTLDLGIVINRALELASSADECMDILEDRDFDDDENNDEHVELEDRVYMKLIGFFTTVDECVEFWGDYENDAPYFRAAVCRAADIIRSRTCPVCGTMYPSEAQFCPKDGTTLGNA